MFTNNHFYSLYFNSIGSSRSTYSPAQIFNQGLRDQILRLQGLHYTPELPYKVRLRQGCYHYDSFGGDDTAVLSLYSTEEKAFEAGRKKEKEAQERWEKNKSVSYRKKPSFDGFFVHGYGDYYVKIMEVDKETI